MPAGCRGGLALLDAVGPPIHAVECEQIECPQVQHAQGRGPPVQLGEGGNAGAVAGDELAVEDGRPRGMSRST